MLDIRTEASGKWPSIMCNLGIDVGDGSHVPCPICGGEDRFRFDNQDGSGSYFCNQCGPRAGYGIDLVMRYFGIEFKDAAKKVRSVLGISSDCDIPQKDNVEKNCERMMAIWNDSIPVQNGDPVWSYLEGRGIPFQPNKKVIRFCPKCYESETKTTIPAMVSAVMTPDYQVATLHRTFLERSKGVWVKASLDSPRKFMPKIRPLTGSAIRLFEATDTLGIAEGIETAIACNKKWGLPVWACTSSTLMESFIPPGGVNTLCIFGDNDKLFAGQKAAYSLAVKYSGKLAVSVNIPELPGADWLDVLTPEGQYGEPVE